MQTLRRTPLHDRHVALGARIVPFAGWEMPVQYEGVIPEHRAVRTDAGVFDVSHMGELEVEGPTARDLLQATLSNDVDRLDAGEAQYTLLTNESGGIVDDLIVYRLDAHRYLLVVERVEPRAPMSRGSRSASSRGSDVRDVSDEYALLAVQGPRALERLGLGACEAVHLGDGRGRRRRGRWSNRTGYTGEEGVELACMAEDAGRLWDAILARGVVPCGLGARDTLRLEVCYPLHGNDIGPSWDAISAGLGWACALDKDFTGVERAARDQGGRARAEARRVRDDRAGDPAPGHGDRGRRRGDLGVASRRCSTSGSAWAYVPRRRAAGQPWRRELTGRRRAEAPAQRARSSHEADLQEGGVNVAASESYPDDLLYHPEHDWARIEGDEAVLGVTWFAHDALGELVHYEPPEVGATVAKDASYGEVESVKAVSDLIAPLSGEVLEVNQQVVDAPETVNEDPYGEGWLIRIRLDEPGRARRAARRRGLPRGPGRGVSYLSLTDADREAMLAAIGVASVEELFRDIPAGVRFGRELDVPPALAEAELHAAPRGARREERRRRGLVPRRRHLRPLRPGGRRRGAPARRVPDRVHAVPARAVPGRAAGDLRVPDRDLRADRHGRLERLRLRRHDRRRRRLLRREGRDRAQRRSSSPRRRTRRCARS